MYEAYGRINLLIRCESFLHLSHLHLSLRAPGGCPREVPWPCSAHGMMQHLARAQSFAGSSLQTRGIRTLGGAAAWEALQLPPVLASSHTCICTAHGSRRHIPLGTPTPRKARTTEEEAGYPGGPRWKSASPTPASPPAWLFQVISQLRISLKLVIFHIVSFSHK